VQQIVRRNCDTVASHAARRFGKRSKRSSHPATHAGNSLYSRRYSVFDRLVSAAACRSVITQPIALLSVLDVLDDGVLLLDDHGNSLWANTVFASAIRADPDSDRILAETRRLAAAVTIAGELTATASPEPRVRAVARTDIR